MKVSEGPWHARNYGSNRVGSMVDMLKRYRDAREKNYLKETSSASAVRRRPLSIRIQY
jgi:hypothetical protein